MEVLREALRRRVGETSLQVAADEVGLSKKGVDKLLAGSNPHGLTIRKLTEWYLKGAAAGQLEIRAEVVQAALEVLVAHLPPGRRVEAKAKVREVVEGIGRKGGRSDGG